MAAPVLFSLQSLTGTVNNRQITVTPDSIQNPLFYGTNLLSLSPFTLQPVGGQAITNLEPWGYTIRVDGWPRSAHIVVPNDTNTHNAVSLLNTNQFSPLNIYETTPLNPSTGIIFVTNGDGSISISSTGGGGGGGTNLLPWQIQVISMALTNAAAFAAAGITNLTSSQIQIISMALTNAAVFASASVTNLTAVQIQIISMALTNAAAFDVAGTAVAAVTALGNAAVGNTNVMKVAAATNADVAASVSGNVNAAQLTGTVPLAQLPAGVVTNVANGVILAGSFVPTNAPLSNIVSSVNGSISLVTTPALNKNVPNGRVGVNFTDSLTASNYVTIGEDVVSEGAGGWAGEITLWGSATNGYLYNLGGLFFASANLKMSGIGGSGDPRMFVFRVKDESTNSTGTNGSYLLMQGRYNPLAQDQDTTYYNWLMAENTGNVGIGDLGERADDNSNGDLHPSAKVTIYGSPNNNYPALQIFHDYSSTNTPIFQVSATGVISGNGNGLTNVGSGSMALSITNTPDTNVATAWFKIKDANGNVGWVLGITNQP